MLDIQLLRTDLAHVARVLAMRNYVFPTTEFSTLEAERKNLQTYTEELQARRNAASRQIGNAKSRGEDVSGILAEVANLGDELRQAEAQLQKLKPRCSNYCCKSPICPIAACRRALMKPIIARYAVGEPRTFDFMVRDHVSIGEGLGLLDFPTATKLSGARFSLMTGALARLHRALAQFMLDTHTQEHGYTETYVPYLVNAESLRGTGQLPKFKEDLFEIPRKRRVQLKFFRGKRIIKTRSRVIRPISPKGMICI